MSISQKNKLLKYLWRVQANSDSRQTATINLAEVAFELCMSKGHLKSELGRMQKKGLLEKTATERAGKSSWSEYRLTQEGLTRVVKLDDPRASVGLKVSLPKPEMTMNRGEEPHPVVYFIKEKDGPFIKIGITDNVQKRVRALQTGNPKKLVLLGYFPATQITEKWLHRRFNHLRQSGEWFKEAPEILEYIRIACEIPDPV